jgi:hypothetical protein
MAFILVPAFILLLGWVVMTLWNSILPDVIHAGRISYLQALGIFILSKILMGGFRYFPRPWQRPANMNPLRDKWMQMTDEEKEKFREEWKKRCG